MNNRGEVACDHCFTNSQLSEWIREHGNKADCPWCGARNAYVVALSELGPIFRDVATIYKPIESPEDWERGERIAFFLQEDWNIFSEKIETAPDNLMDELVVAVLRAGLHPKHDVDHTDYAGLFLRDQPWLAEHWHERAEAFLTETGASARAVAGRNTDYAWFADEL